MPLAYVKAYVKRQKNDATDAEAICEAVKVQVRSFGQLYLAPHARIGSPKPGSHQERFHTARVIGRSRPEISMTSAYTAGKRTNGDERPSHINGGLYVVGAPADFAFRDQGWVICM
jgi:hypothetical protein